MGVNGEIDLTAEQRQLVLELIERHLPDTDVWAYGSRVKWTSRPESDLDLVVFSGPEQNGQVADLREALEESDLPFQVDVLVWDDTLESVQREIDTNHCAVVEVRTPVSTTKMRFGNCATLIRDHVDPSDLSDDTPYVGLGHIPKNQLSVTNHGVASDVTSMKSRFKRGDILFGGLRPYFRKVALARYDGICSTDIWVVRAQNGLDQQFLFYQMAAQRFVDYASQGSEGTRMPRANWDYVSDYTLIVPSLPEQRRVTRILDGIDDRLVTNHKITSIMDDTMQAQFRTMMDQYNHDKYSDLSAGCRLVRLGDVMTINPHRSLQKGTKAPYLSMANMPTSGHSPLSIVERPYGHGMRFTNGDTLVARITPCLENGKTAYVDFLLPNAVGWGSTEYVVLRPKSPVPTEFAYCLARSSSFRDFAVGSMTGSSGRQRVSAQVLAEHQFVLPPPHVLDDFSNVARLCVSRARSAVLESLALTGMRDVLLSAMVTRTYELEDKAK